MKFIQERPKFKNQIERRYESKRDLRENYLKYSNYDECQKLLKMIHDLESVKEVNFRKSVDDLNFKLNSNKNPKIQREKSENFKTNHNQIVLNNKSDISEISLHDKLVYKMKFNRTKRIDKIQSGNEIFLNQENGNKKLTKQLKDIQIKYSQKTEESKANSSYFTSKKFLRTTFKDKDSIDQILISSLNNFSKLDKNEQLSSTSRFNNFSFEPNMWTPRSEEM